MNSYRLIGQGEENEDEIEPEADDMLGRKELKQIQEDIEAIVRPTWQTRLPSNFGSPSGGKLKADVWRTGMEFDLIVSLVKMWSKPTATDRQKKAVESTILLAIALRWGTSHRTSEHHGEQYTQHMVAYLKTIRELRPHKNLHPIHHNALHYPKFLLLFGPSHCWWMFPFERLIGKLQQVHINNKLGTYQMLRNRI
jgi:hypothetical protein